MSNAPKNHATAAPAINFIRNHIDADLAEGKYAPRKWSGQPGPAAQQLAGQPDPARIRTRFPPEPNGYLHFGHAKSICLNFGLARDYGGHCHLRFDDTNPEKEDQEYVDSIIDAVKWLGFSWEGRWREQSVLRSNYFDWMVQFAEYLLASGHAYVDSQSAEAMRAARGTLTEAGQDSPYRSRSVAENLDLFKRMQAGEFADGEHSCAPRSTWRRPTSSARPGHLSHPSCHAPQHRRQMVRLSDVHHRAPDRGRAGNVTHSICTLEFADQRPFYDWLLERLAEGGLLQRPLPQQLEFSRLKSDLRGPLQAQADSVGRRKTRLRWDDPRLPTLVGARRRGYTAEGFRLFADRIGVSKSDSLIEYSLLEEAMREVLNPLRRAPRGGARSTQADHRQLPGRRK